MVPTRVRFKKPPRPDQYMVEVSEEAAATMLAHNEIRITDFDQHRGIPPTCKKNEIAILDHNGQLLFNIDLYYDGETDRWLIGLTPQQYGALKQVKHIHDSLGVVVV